MHNEHQVFYFSLTRDLHEYILNHLVPTRTWIIIDAYGDDGREYWLAYRDSDDPNGPYVIDEDYPSYPSKARAIRVRDALNAD